jgi:hypothetical protein
MARTSEGNADRARGCGGSNRGLTDIATESVKGLARIEVNPETNLGINPGVTPEVTSTFRRFTVSVSSWIDVLTATIGVH